MNVAEDTLASGVFGTVTDKRVIYQRAKGWFSGGSREDIPLRHITSVRLDTTRNILGGLLLLLIGLPFLAIGVGFILMALGVILLWGSPTVVVNTAGRDLNASKGWPWHRSDATHFVDAIRDRLVRQ